MVAEKRTMSKPQKEGDLNESVWHWQTLFLSSVFRDKAHKTLDRPMNKKGRPKRSGLLFSSFSLYRRHFIGGTKGIHCAKSQQRKKTSGMCTIIWSTE